MSHASGHILEREMSLGRPEPGRRRIRPKRRQPDRGSARLLVRYYYANLDPKDKKKCANRRLRLGLPTVKARVDRSLFQISTNVFADLCTIH
jgi:hypothetical protein